MELLCLHVMMDNVLLCYDMVQFFIGF